MQISAQIGRLEYFSTKNNNPKLHVEYRRHLKKKLHVKTEE